MYVCRFLLCIVKHWNWLSLSNTKIKMSKRIGESLQLYSTSLSYWRKTVALGRNKSRQCCANNVTCCLRSCCRGFKQMQQLRKNRNNMQQGVKKDATCNIQQCCVRRCTGRPNIVGCYMLRPFAHPQGTPCCKMLHVVASYCWKLLRKVWNT